MVEITIIVDLTALEEKYINVYYGGLVSVANFIMINNTSIDEHSSIYITADSNYYNSSSGGLVGKANNLVISKSYNSGMLTSSTEAGGLVGTAENLVISNSYNIGTINGTGYVGGLVGSTGQSKFSTFIENSYNSGKITSNYRAGGLLGIIRFPEVAVIKNSFNSGVIIGTDDIGGIASHPNSSVIDNCYSYATTEQLNSLDFYVNILGWEQNIWNFDYLDSENGIYPKLKR